MNFYEWRADLRKKAVKALKQIETISVVAFEELHDCLANAIIRYFRSLTPECFKYLDGYLFYRFRKAIEFCLMCYSGFFREHFVRSLLEVRKQSIFNPLAIAESSFNDFYNYVSR